jgi:hypothetical protein
MYRRSELGDELTSKQSTNNVVDCRSPALGFEDVSGKVLHSKSGCWPCRSDTLGRVLMNGVLECTLDLCSDRRRGLVEVRSMRPHQR